MQGSFQQYMGNKGAFHPQSEKERHYSDEVSLKRQQIGEQNRLPVPVTTLHHGQKRVDRQRKLPGRKFSPHTGDRGNPLQVKSGITYHQGIFETDTEDGDRTTTLSEVSKDDLKYQNVDFSNTKSRYQSEFSPASSIHGYEGLDPAQSMVESESEAEAEDTAEDEASQDSGSGDEQAGKIDPRGKLPPEILEELNRPEYAQSEGDRWRAQDPNHFTGHAVATLPPQINKANLGYQIDGQGPSERRSPSVAPCPRLEDGQAATLKNKHSVHLDHLPHRSSSIDRHHYDHKSVQRQKANLSTPEIRTGREPAPLANPAIESNQQYLPPDPLEHVEEDTRGSPGVFDPSSLDDDILPGNIAGTSLPTDANETTSISQPSTNKRILELDYPPNQLAAMTYNQLSSQSFDHDPKATASVYPPDGDRATLPEMLASLQQSKADSQHSQNLRSFFSSLKIDQYDECGDIMIEQITKIMDQYRKARRRKRQAAQKFEAEVADRERSVSQGIDAVEHGLKRLKRAGEDVVRGKGS